MAIKSVKELHKGKLKIDLTGPQGNAFVILGYAQSLSEQLGKDYEDISKRMESGNYDNLIDVFNEEFGDYVDLYR